MFVRLDYVFLRKILDKIDYDLNENDIYISIYIYIYIYIYLYIYKIISDPRYTECSSLSQKQDGRKSLTKARWT